MIPLMAIMVGAYIVLRSLEIIVQEKRTADKVGAGILNIVAVLVIMAATVCTYLIMSMGGPGDLSTLIR